MADPRSPVLVVEGVVKEYGAVAKTRALDGVDLTIGPGELTALVGPSGSGKSTLLNLIGLLDRPTAGRVVLGGIDTTVVAETRKKGWRPQPAIDLPALDSQTSTR